MDFEGHVDTPDEDTESIRQDRYKYYEKLGGALFGVCLPGLGYDTFKMWELLTIGSVVIIERAVGLDRTVRALCYLLFIIYYLFLIPLFYHVYFALLSFL